MKIDILHVRDPDGYCEHSIFVDGVEVDYTSPDVNVESIDAGAGWERSAWDERIADAEALPDSAYKRVLVEVLRDPPGGQYID